MQSDETRISEDRREALRYALAIGSGGHGASPGAVPGERGVLGQVCAKRLRPDARSLLG